MLSEKNFMDALNDIDDAYLYEYISTEKPAGQRKPFHRRRWIIAACICVFLFSAFLLNQISIHSGDIMYEVSYTMKYVTWNGSRYVMLGENSDISDYGHSENITKDMMGDKIGTAQLLPDEIHVEIYEYIDDGHEPSQATLLCLLDNQLYYLILE